jgi:chemotaxis protein MotB
MSNKAAEAISNEGAETREVKTNGTVNPETLRSRAG